LAHAENDKLDGPIGKKAQRGSVSAQAPVGRCTETASASKTANPSVIIITAS